MKYRILDLDNCIADDAWRIQHINWQQKDLFLRYVAYHQLAPWDWARNHELFANYNGSIIVITGRPVFFRAAAEEWLRRNGIQFAHMIMRNDHDYRYSVEVKRTAVGGLSEYDVALKDIEMAYDDHEPVVSMYREFGIPAAMKRIHDISAYRGNEAQT